MLRALSRSDAAPALRAQRRGMMTRASTCCSRDVAPRDDARRGTAYGALRDGAIGDPRRQRSRGSARRATLPRDVRGARTLGLRRPLAHARPRRLPHASRVRRQSRARVRAAAATARPTPTSRARAAASAPRCARRAPRPRTSSPRRVAPRLAALAAEGVTTVEIKSGYGLDTANEAEAAARRARARRRARRRRAHHAARRARAAAGVRRPRDAYIDYVCRDTIPAVARGGPRRRGRRVLRDRSASRRRRRAACSTRRARTACRVKLHADQLSDLGGAALAARVSARCRPIISSTRARRASRRWRAAGTVAVLLPGAFYALRETTLPPIEALRRARRADGASPPTAIRARRRRRRSSLMMNMACTLFGTDAGGGARAASRATRARALGLADRGVLDVGHARRPRAAGPSASRRSSPTASAATRCARRRARRRASRAGSR